MPVKQLNNQEQHEEENETLDFTKPDFVFLPKGNHTYRQSGPYLICKTCDIQHATFIGMKLIMVGVSQTGEPILKKRKDIGM